MVVWDSLVLAAAILPSAATPQTWFQESDSCEGSVVYTVGILKSRIGGCTFLNPPKRVGQGGEELLVAAFGTSSVRVSMTS